MKRAMLFLGVLIAGIVIGWLIAPRESAQVDPMPVEVARDAEVEHVSGPPRQEPTPDPVAAPASLKGDVPEPEEAAPSPRAPTNPRVKVHIEVQNPDGSTPAQAVIRWLATPDTPDNGGGWTWTPTGRTMHVLPREGWVRAFGGARDSMKSDAHHLKLEANGPPQDLTLVLRERACVLGRVILPGEFERPRLTVNLQRFSGTEPPAKPTFARSAARVSPRAQYGYSFAFHDLEPGGYLLGLSLGREVYRVVETVWVEDGIVEKDLVVESFDPKHFMEVKVIGPDGHPLRDVQLSIRFRSGSFCVAGGNIELQREDGVYIVDHNPAYTLGEDGEYAEGHYVLHVMTRGHGNVYTSYDPRSTESLTIRVRETEHLAIRLMDYANSLVAGKLTAGVRPAGLTDVGSFPGQVGSEGVVQFGQLQPGRYDILLLIDASRPVPVAFHSIEHVSSADVHEIPTPVLHRLTLNFARDSEDPAFSLHREFGPQRRMIGWGELSVPGEMVFENLTQGTYSLEGHLGERRVKRDVDIPADAVIHLD